MATPESTRGAAHESTIITICDYNTKNPLATPEPTLEPTPEPATLLLAAAGLPFLLKRRRNKV